MLEAPTMSTNQESLPLGQVLLGKGLINVDQLTESLKEQRASGEFLGTILLKRKWITEKQLVVALSSHFKIPSVTLDNFYVDWELVMLFTPSLIVDRKCFPLKSSIDTVIFAIVNPLDAYMLAQAEHESRNKKVQLVLVTESDMQEIIRRYRQHVLIKIRHTLDGKD